MSPVSVSKIPGTIICLSKKKLTLPMGRYAFVYVLSPCFLLLALYYFSCLFPVNL